MFDFLSRQVDTHDDTCCKQYCEAHAQCKASPAWSWSSAVTVQDCELCHLGDDQYCPKMVVTYNGSDWGDDGRPTQGGYSDKYIINHK